MGDEDGEGRAYGGLGNAYWLLGECQKGIKYLEKDLKIAVEIGNRAAELIAYHNIGVLYYSLEQFESAVDNFNSAMNLFFSSRFLLKSEDDWEIKFREVHERTFTGLYRWLLGIGKVDEALFAAEQGRA